jgi:hypothetical protein
MSGRLGLSVCLPARFCTFRSIESWKLERERRRQRIIRRVLSTSTSPRFSKALFTSNPKHKIFQDSSSHRIFRHMHGVLNIDENKNELYSLVKIYETNLLSLVSLCLDNICHIQTKELL